MPKRSKARVLALQIIFQLQSQSDDFLEQVDGFIKDANLEPPLGCYGREIALGAWTNRSEADALIDKFARDWTAASLPDVDRAVLRLAIYEMIHCSDVPPKVAIDEAIKLAKIYSTQRSSQFINGLLDTIMKSTLSNSEDTIPNNKSSE